MEPPDQQESRPGNRPAVDRKARLQIPPVRPDKQQPETRTSNWDEVYHLYTESAARIEAERCIQCPAAPCMKACPVHNDIPGAFWLLERGDIEGAADVFRETSELPEMCGRLCPQERLCEGHCVVGKNALPVAIGKLETFVTEWQREHGGGTPAVQAEPTGRRVAIVGTGPAGIAVAERLAQRGHSVTMYDSWPEPGGVLRYGIPTFKQNKPAVDRKFRDLEALGVQVRCNTTVGKDISWDALRNSADAVFVGIGASEGARLGLPSEDARGVISATEFLVRTNLPASALPQAYREPLGVPRSVVVVGGGDTSMDCVRSARRLGCNQVTLVYRRTEAEMQGRVEERTHAREEGVQFEYLASPVEILLGADGAVTALRCVRMELGEPDDTGRRTPRPVEGSEFDLPADVLILAIGYNVDEEWGQVVPDMTRDRWNRLVADPETLQTNLAGVFVGGDDVNGADLVVTALADGHRAAEAIEEYLRTLLQHGEDESGPLVGDSSLM